MQAVLLSEWPAEFDGPMSDLLDELEAGPVPVELCAESEGCPTDSVWMRDYGPLPVWSAEGELQLGDARYFSFRDQDDAVPSVYAGRLGLELVEVDLPLEGGNLLRDGSGLCVAGASIHENHSWSAEEAAQRLEVLGCTELVWLQTLEGEPTDHVDLFVALSSELAVVGEGSDPALEAAAQALEAWLPVERVPQPEAVDLDGDGELDFPSFTNVLRVANAQEQLLFVPTYAGLPEESERALRVWAEIEPGWRVVGIESTELVAAGGALHCVTQGLPAAEPELEECGCSSSRSSGAGALVLLALALQRRRARPAGLTGRRRSASRR